MWVCRGNGTMCGCVNGREQGGDVWRDVWVFRGKWNGGRLRDVWVCKWQGTGGGWGGETCGCVAGREGNRGRRRDVWVCRGEGGTEQGQKSKTNRTEI